MHAQKAAWFERAAQPRRRQAKGARVISRAIRLAAVLLTMAVAGCASGGNEVLRAQDANAVDRNIVDGKTTRSDVERLYGPPNATSFANAQNDIWIYRWARSTARAENFIPYVGAFVGGSDVQKKELVILFNEQNMVVRHSMRDSTEFRPQEPQRLIEPDTQCGADLDVAGATGERRGRCRAFDKGIPERRHQTRRRRAQPRRRSIQVAGPAGSTMSAMRPGRTTRSTSWLARTAPLPSSIMKMLPRQSSKAVRGRSPQSTRVARA